MIRRFLPLLIVLAVTALLVISVQGFVRHVIVGPLLYVLWFISLVVRSLPQGFYWILFIVLALILAVSSLRRNRADAHHRRWPSRDTLGPVASWHTLIRRSEKQTFARWRLARELSRLTWTLLAPEEPFNTGFSAQHLQILDPRITPDVVDYLNAGHEPYQTPIHGRRSSLSRRQSTALDTNPEEVIDYLEHLLDNPPHEETP